MRSIKAELIKDTVARLCIEANAALPEDVERALNAAAEKERWPGAKASLGLLQENLRCAEKCSLPICQDTGLACVFIELGQDVHIEGSLREAVNEGVRKGYGEGYLRKSAVDPLRRINTGDNTPALLSLELCEGEICRITVLPKGFGSENMSRIAMLKPAEGIEGVKKFVLETVAMAGSNPCPPIVLGVGIGGTFDKAAALAKKALLRPIGEHNSDKLYAEFEKELLEKVNSLGIGPQGFGGENTALGLAIEYYPTHVAGLPVAVNISCHATRRASAEI